MILYLFFPLPVLSVSLFYFDHCLTAKVLFIHNECMPDNYEMQSAPSTSIAASHSNPSIWSNQMMEHFSKLLLLHQKYNIFFVMACLSFCRNTPTNQKTPANPSIRFSLAGACRKATNSHWTCSNFPLLRHLLLLMFKD